MFTCSYRPSWSRNSKHSHLLLLSQAGNRLERRHSCTLLRYVSAKKTRMLWTFWKQFFQGGGVLYFKSIPMPENCPTVSRWGSNDSKFSNHADNSNYTRVHLSCKHQQDLSQHVDVPNYMCASMLFCFHSLSTWTFHKLCWKREPYVGSLSIPVWRHRDPINGVTNCSSLAEGCRKARLGVCCFTTDTSVLWKRSCLQMRGCNYHRMIPP